MKGQMAVVKIDTRELFKLVAPSTRPMTRELEFTRQPPESPPRVAMSVSSRSVSRRPPTLSTAWTPVSLVATIPLLPYTYADVPRSELIGEYGAETGRSSLYMFPITHP